MLKFMPMLKLDKVNDAGGAGGAADSKPPEKQPPAEGTPPPQESGSEFDELGYKIEKKVEPPKEEGKKDEKGGKPPEVTPPKAEDIKDPATGYGVEPPKASDIKVEPPKADPPAASDETDKLLEGLPKDELAKTKDFAVKNKMTPEQIKAYVDMRKGEMKEFETARVNMENQAKQADAERKAAWYKELKDDSTFGGDKFGSTTLNAEKFLGDFGPELKKQLTEGKGMLPPNIVRMMARAAAKLYATDTMVQGDPVVPSKDEKETDSALDYYT